MATRIFEAHHIHERAKAALIGLKLYAEHSWQEIVDRDYNRKLGWIEEENKCIFRRMGIRKMRTPPTRDAYEASMKTGHDGWSINEWRIHRRVFDPKIAEMTKLVQLSGDLVYADKRMTLGEDDYSFICRYEDYQ